MKAISSTEHGFIANCILNLGNGMKLVHEISGVISFRPISAPECMDMEVGQKDGNLAPKKFLRSL